MTIRPCFILFMTLLLLVAVSRTSAAVAMSRSCEEQTATLMGNPQIKAAYQDITSTNHNISYFEDGTVSFWMDYSTSDLLPAYQTTCESNGGVYRGINFKATCVKTTSESSSPSSTHRLVVNDFPRCYGKSCTQDMDNDLLSDFTLRPTENLNKNHGQGGYETCTGYLFDDDDAGASDCVSETGALLQLKSVTDAYDSLKPQVTRKGSTELGPTHVETVLRYNPAATNFKGICIFSGGRYYEPDFHVPCWIPRFTNNYKAVTLPLCAGISCRDQDIHDLQNRFFSQLATTVLVDAGDLEPDEEIRGCGILEHTEDDQMGPLQIVAWAGLTAFLIVLIRIWYRFYRNSTRLAALTEGARGLARKIKRSTEKRDLVTITESFADADDLSLNGDLDVSRLSRSGSIVSQASSKLFGGADSENVPDAVLW